MTRPNFLFIGPDKTGSTWMAEILRAHPDCYVPPLKDVYFFDRYFDRGLSWYLNLFRDAPAEAKAVGELSHDYLYSALAAERIAASLPGVRLITSLRDPVQRSFSHYLYLRRNGLTALPFHQACVEIAEIVDHSRYARHLRPYLEQFGPARLKILYFEQLERDPRGFARELFEFLGVPFVPDLPYERRVLAASRARSPLVARAVRAGAQLARRLGFTSLVGTIKRSGVKRLLYREYLPSERPRVTPATERHLRSVLEDDLAELEGLLGRSLAEWR